MVKVFLSHSSQQKPFVLEVVKHIGRDIAVVDCFEFESGRKISDEIEKTISNTNIFVFLASREAVESRACREELQIVRDFVDENKVVFCAFKIDNSISIDKVKPWIRNWLINHYDSPFLLARMIRRTVNELLWERFPKSLVRLRTFQGRGDELAQIDRLLFSRSLSETRALVVSGMPHVGRKALLRASLVSSIHKSFHVSYEPLRVMLSDKDSIEDLIVQLNQFVMHYGNEEIFELMKVGENCKDIAVELLNKISKNNERIIIDDNRCVVNSQGRLTDWFVEVINHECLEPHIHFFIASTITLLPSELRIYPAVKSMQIKALSLECEHMLFNAYAALRDVNCPSSMVKSLIEPLTGYPEQILDLVDDIADHDLMVAKNDLPNIVRMYDKDITSILEIFKDDGKSMQLLILLSKFEFVSFDLLRQIVPGDDLEKMFSDFHRYGIYEAFGSSNQYFRLNPAISDYIERNKMRLSKENRKALNRITKELISQTNDSSQDLATQLYRIKQLIKTPNLDVDDKYLLPSFALKVIAELYIAGDYENVVALARKILYDHNRHNYETVQYSIRYWLCLSYCKLQMERELFDEVKYFKSHTYTYNFLIGYYHRISGNYSRALDFYDRALSKVKTTRRSYVSKAEHEKAITLMKLGDYNNALDLARTSYENNPVNPYHIEAYFRCLIRSKEPDVVTLQELMDAMSKSYDAHKIIMLHTFKAEYKYYIEKNWNEAINQLTDIIKGQTSDYRNYAVDSLRQICRRQGLMTLFNSTMRGIDDFKENKDFVAGD